MRNLLLLCALLATACAGGTSETTTSESTDVAVEPTAGGEMEPEAAPVMRSTTPIPVPQPGVLREELSEPMQAVWTTVEEAVAVRPPNAPEDATLELVDEWVRGPFQEFVTTRQRSMRQANAGVAALGEAAAEERGAAAALFGYMYEDMASALRGAPIPTEIAEDPELLEVYVSALGDALHPFALMAARAYLVCATTLVELGAESPWAAWANYCDARGAEVVSVFELQSREPPAEGPESESESDAQPAAAETEAEAPGQS